MTLTRTHISQKQRRHKLRQVEDIVTKHLLYLLTLDEFKVCVRLKTVEKVFLSKMLADHNALHITCLLQ